jgi:hypothetical protein
VISTILAYVFDYIVSVSSGLVANNITSAFERRKEAARQDLQFSLLHDLAEPLSDALELYFTPSLSNHMREKAEQEAYHIGKRAHAIGGYSAMLILSKTLNDETGQYAAKLNYLWNRIGEDSNRGVWVP